MASIKIECINDAAYVKAAQEQADSIESEAESWAAIQIALLVAQVTSSSYIADKQAELADRRYTMAKEAVEHAKKTWSYEQAFVQDTMGEAVHQPLYATAQIVMQETDRMEDLALEETEKHLTRLGMTVGACDDTRMKRGMAVARTDLVAHSMRSAEARAFMLNDRRYSRQLTAVGLGRGKLRDAVALGRIGDTREGLRQSLIGTINSGMTLWGYSNNRWSHGGNYATGSQGAPRVVPEGSSLWQRTDAMGNTITTVERNAAQEAAVQSYERQEFFKDLSSPDVGF